MIPRDIRPFGRSAQVSLTALFRLDVVEPIGEVTNLALGVPQKGEQPDDCEPQRDDDEEGELGHVRAGGEC